MIELQFLHSVLSLMAIYQCIKFHLIPFYTFRDILQTSLILRLLITTTVARWLGGVGGGGGEGERGGLPTLKPVKLTIYHMQPFRASVLIQE